MTDSAKGSPAWAVSPADYLARRRRSYAPGVRTRSSYVAMRDGTRLAVDVHLPAGADPAARLPTVAIFTPYYRRFWLADTAPPGTEASPNYASYRDGFTPFGYAVAIVDVRGTGASFGSRAGFRSPDERLDYGDAVDWIARQPWSDGRIGITGISYVGAAADFAASTGHPAIRAVMPTFSVWDTWGDMFYPGGLLFTGMIGGYGRMIEALDMDRRDVLQEFPYFAGDSFAGPAPVDDDPDGAMLSAAVAEHAANFDTTDLLTQLAYRDAVLRHDPDMGSEAIAPRSYLEGIDPALPHYGVSGWMDGAAYTNGCVTRYRALPNHEKRLLLGPWDHGARTHVSPFRDGPRPAFEMHGEILRFFDQHVAGLETGLGAERPIHYFTMVEEAWKAADTWPPAGTSPQRLFLGAEGTLAPMPPEADGVDLYRTDHALGTGRQTRFERIAGQPVEDYYADWDGRDAAMATWTSPPLAEAVEVTGHAVADLWIASEARDGAFVVYLEDVEPDGRRRYVTEGCLRALHRATAAAPANYPQIGPFHPCSAGAAELLDPGVPARVEIALMPTSWLFRKGHRIRLAFAAGDRDHLARVPFGSAPLLQVFRSRALPSSLTLPVLRA